MWEALQKKYGPERKQMRPRLPERATRDLLVHASDLLRVVASLRLLSSGDVFTALPSSQRDAFHAALVAALPVLEREVGDVSPRSALSVDAVAALRLALVHAPRLHVATDASLGRDRRARPPCRDDASRWWDCPDASAVNALPLAIDEVPSMRVVRGAVAPPEAACTWTGDLDTVTGMSAVLSVDFSAAKATLTVAVDCTGTFDVRDVVRSRNSRAVQFVITVPPAADDTTRSIAERLGGLTLKYSSSARRLRCPARDVSTAVRCCCSVASPCGAAHISSAAAS